MKILVRATNWIGDAVISLPALRLLRERFPTAEISVLAKPWVADLYQGESAVNRLIPLEGASGARDWAAKWRMAAKLRSQKFDLAVLFPNSFESAALPFLAGIPKRIGYARDGRSPLLTTAVPLPKRGEIPHHERYYYLELLRRAGLTDRNPDSEEIRFEGGAAARARGAALFQNRGISGPVVGVSPGAAYGTAKRWLPERFAEAARRLADRMGGSVVVFGSSAEQELCAWVATAASGVSLAGATSLREFIDMTAACDFYLANDSGAMHIAAALGVSSVTVFGPTDETATGPSGPAARIVREPVECAPCKLRECPIDHRCMTRVTADRVVEEASGLILPSQ
jgi:heptosyltransferase-2